jgi:hypothetical protein
MDEVDVIGLATKVAKEDNQYDKKISEDEIEAVDDFFEVYPILN